MFRIAIVEDDNLYTLQLEEYIKKYQEESGVEFQIITFSDGEDLVEQYSADYDLILMDIQMRFMNGFEAAKKIRKLDKSVQLVFVTNSIQYAIRGYSVNALDYVVKPVNYFKFSQVMKRAMESVRDDEKYISLHTNTGTYKVSLKDIFYIESRYHDLCYMTKHGEYIVRGALAECYKALSPYGFYQVQKSYVVNMKMVEQIKTDSCIVNGTEIMISRTKKKDFMQEILNHMSDIDY